jgi:hypothetical protein
MGAAEAGTSVFNNNLLKILDGQECRVESKDSTLFQKTRNVPIVMIGNKLPNCIKENGPFRARFHRMPFFTNIYDLREERVIATLNGCIRRRLGLCYKKFVESQSMLLKYNESYLVTLEREISEIIRDQKEAPTQHPELFPLFDEPFFGRERGCCEISLQ